MKDIININPTVIIMLFIMVVAVCCLIFFSSNGKKLNSFKAKEVGDGQHGNDRFMTDNEARELYTVIKLPEEITDKSNEFPSGRMVNYNEKTRECYIDTSDTHAKVAAPTEAGKSTEYVIPNVQYNIMAGTTMIVMDIKKEIYEKTAQDAKNCGYKIYTLDFQNPEESDLFDFFEDINESMDHYIKYNDLKSKATVEDAAGALVMDIVHSRKHSNNENPFFEKASKGVIHSLIQLVTLLGKKEQKHIGSISNILQGMLQIPKEKTDKTPIILRIMRKLPDSFGAKKYLGAAFAATEETEGNIYASVLGDLEPFINSIAEQIIAKPGNEKNIFSYQSILNEKCILYIIIPETKEQFKVYGTAIIRKLYNQLTEYANTLPGKKLPKRIYIPWEEFALYPEINNIEDWLSIMRGRGMITDLVYQSDHQLTEKYGENIMNILKDQCAVSIYLALAQEDIDTAERISKALGNKTILTGSVSESHDSSKSGSLLGGTSHSTTKQMMDRALMTPSEVLHMDQYGFKLLLRRNQYPFKTHLTGYYKPEWGLTPTPIDDVVIVKNEIKDINYMTYDELMENLDDYVQSNTTIKKEMIAKENENTTNYVNPKYNAVAMQLLDITNGDTHALELLESKNYRNLIKYMKKYRKEISSYDLQKLLEPLAE